MKLQFQIDPQALRNCCSELDQRIADMLEIATAARDTITAATLSVTIEPPKNPQAHQAATAEAHGQQTIPDQPHMKTPPTKPQKKARGKPYNPGASGRQHQPPD